jgi:hypothetical protein
MATHQLTGPAGREGNATLPFATVQPFLQRHTCVRATEKGASPWQHLARPSPFVLRALQQEPIDVTVRIQSNALRDPPEPERLPKLPRLYTEKQVAQAFGVTDSAMYRWRLKGIIKPVLIGTRVFYTEEEIARFRREGAPFEGKRAAPPPRARRMA